MYLHADMNSNTQVINYKNYLKHIFFNIFVHDLLFSYRKTNLYFT